VRDVDWNEVVAILDSTPVGQPVLVAELDQSVRTHLRNGRVVGVDPDLYDIWTEAIDGSRTRARIFMARKP
jgi:hypothetical protein